MDETREKDFDIVHNSDLDEFLDLPPEFCQYRDEGCELFDACLECPFPHCLLEEKGASKRKLKQIRALQISGKHRGGRNDIATLGAMFGVSHRTARRALKEARVMPRARGRNSRRNSFAPPLAEEDDSGTGKAPPGSNRVGRIF